MAGSHVVTHADGTEYDLGGEWRAITLYGSLSAALGEEVSPATPMATRCAIAEKHGVPVDAPSGAPGKLAEELFEALVGPGARTRRLLCGTIRRRPSPLTRAHRTEPGVTEKWDLYCLRVRAGYWIF